MTKSSMRSLGSDRLPGRRNRGELWRVSLRDLSHAWAELEDQEWYANFVEQVIAKATEKGIIIEINTKKFDSGNRFFPSERWWPLLKKYGAKLVLSTDAHYPDKVAAGYEAAYERLLENGMENQIVEI